MIYLLAAIVIFAIITGFCYRAADRPGDDFGAAIPALFFGLITILLIVAYVALAFWNHRFF